MRPRPEIDPFNYAPRVRLPVLMLNGRYDLVVPLESSARPMFRLLGTPSDNKLLRVYDSDHAASAKRFHPRIAGVARQIPGAGRATRVAVRSRPHRGFDHAAGHSRQHMRVIDHNQVSKWTGVSDDIHSERRSRSRFDASSSCRLRQSRALVSLSRSKSSIVYSRGTPWCFRKASRLYLDGMPSTFRSW